MSRLTSSGLTKTYGNIHALRNVDFDLRAGEVMALLGENGAGKSTFVKALAGLIEPDEGTFAMDGKATTLYPSAQSQGSGIAVVHQEFSTVGPLSVAENLLLGQIRTPFVWTRSNLRRNARTLLQSVGLGNIDPDRKVEDLAVGERQLLEVARALASDAKVVIFDEPTAALSDHEIERVLGLVKDLAAEGRSIIYVTHRLPEVFRIADRVTVFRNGRSAAPVDVADLDVARVVQMMLGRELDSVYPARTSLGDQTRLIVDGLQVPGLREPVTFSARRGEILGLTGQIGSGSNTVLRGLAGIAPILAGSASIDGDDLALGSRRAGIKRGVAYCSDDRKHDGMFAERSVRDNLSAPWLKSISRLGWLSFSRERNEADGIAATFAIDRARMRTNAGMLSGGNQQKVVLGKWLGTRPKVLLVEEPTRGVDVGARAEVYERLRQLCAEGMTIIVASTDTAEVLGLCDTVAAFYHGRLQSMKPADEWTEHDLTIEVMHSEVTA